MKSMNVQSGVLLLLLAACAAAPALAARHTLTATPLTAPATLRCFTGAPPFPDGRPVVVAMIFNKANGFDICVRYQFPCSTSDTSCSAAEAKAGVLKWAYTATSSANCAYLKQVGKNTVCCATDGCNKPDPKLDPTTLIQQIPASAVLAPAPPAPKPTSGQPVPSTAPAPAVKPSAVKPSAAPRTAAATLRCFTSMPPSQDGRPVVMAWTFNKANGFDICVRYQFPCSTSDTSCSAAEAKAGVLKWAYTATSSANCAYLKQVGKNTVCCATDGCNKPDPKLDPTTLIQQIPASAVLAPAPPAPKPTSGQPVPSTAPAPAVKPSAVKPSAAPRTAAATLRCFTSMPPSQDGRPVVMAWTFNKANGFDICVRYQFPCSTSDTSCSAAEAKAGVLKWAYIATSSANCAYLKQVGKNTVCCATDGCNKPDPKLDPTTLIQQNPAAATVLAPAPPAPKPTSGQPVPSTAPAPAVKPSAAKPATVAHITP